MWLAGCAAASAPRGSPCCFLADFGEASPRGPNEGTLGPVQRSQAVAKLRRLIRFFRERDAIASTRPDRFPPCPAAARRRPSWPRSATAPCPFAPGFGRYAARPLWRGQSRADGARVSQRGWHDVEMASTAMPRDLASDPGWSGVRLVHPDEVTDSVKRGSA